MIVLFDYDSLVYGAVYKIASISDIRKWFNEKRSREWMETEITNLSINRLSQMGGRVFLEIEETGIEVLGIEYYLTAAKNSIRKRLYPSYKINRKKNKWVNMVRKEVLSMGFAETHDEYEADDLIKDRAVQLGEKGCIICSIDKDMKQIPGIHFDYYRPRLVDEDGNPQLNENGHRKYSPCRGLDIVTHEEAERFFWKQMLMGDAGDGIKGLKGIGKAKAEKILNTSIDNDYKTTVILAYNEHYSDSVLAEEELIKHWHLLRLGTDTKLVKGETI